MTTFSATSIARLSVIALDCPDPYALARFYSEITGWPLDPGSRDDWVELDAHGAVTIAFQRAPGHRPPEWPDERSPQQLHIDFDVPDLDDGERRVLAVGARKAEVQPKPDSFRVYFDPAGHPFCLVRES
jgi:hypothetical protein